jgi:hypothetical protein
MNHPDTNEVPEGAAVFPLIPAELCVHPLLLVAIHAIVFFDGSSDEVVHDAAADEALQYIATYLQRLDGAELKRIREDIDCVLSYARQEKWPKEEVEFLKGFLHEYGIGDRPQNPNAV